MGYWCQKNPFSKGNQEIEIKIGEQSIEESTFSSSQLSYNIIYVISSLIDSDYSFVDEQQIHDLMILRDKMFKYFSMNSEKIYSYIKKAELWLDITEEETSQIKSSYEIISKRIMEKVILIVMCHVMGNNQVPEDLMKNLE